MEHTVPVALAVRVVHVERVVLAALAARVERVVLAALAAHVVHAAPIVLVLAVLVAAAALLGVCVLRVILVAALQDVQLLVPVILTYLDSKSTRLNSRLGHTFHHKVP